MIRRYKALKRSWIKRKKRVRKESWRNPGRVREDAMGIKLLRWEVFNRSEVQGRFVRHNRCENKLAKGRCPSVLTWEKFHMHHIGPARERSDTLSKVMALCEGCHFDHHNGIWEANRWDLEKQ